MPEETYSAKLNMFLNKKLQESEIKIVKTKRKQRLIKGLYITSIITSVILSSSAVAVTSLFGLPFVPTIIITIFSATSAVSTTLSTKFNLKGKKVQLEKLVDHLNSIKNKLEYVLTCNGNLTEEDYKTILNEF